MTPQEAQEILARCHMPDVELPIIMDGKDMKDALETIAGMQIEHCLLVNFGDKGGVQTLYYASAEAREVALKTYTAKGGLAARMDRLVGPSEVQAF